MSNSLEERLKKEAQFQDERVKQSESGEIEARSRFYYLMENANRFYASTLFDADQTGQKIVVVGCATGGVTPLARKGAEVIGVDISPEAVETLNKAIENEGLSALARAEINNAEDLSYPDATFDTVCCTGVLHHLDVEKSARSWSKVLKTDGRVIMIEPMALNPIIALYRNYTPGMRTEDEHPLLPKDIKILKKYFGKVSAQGFVLTSLASMIWVYLPNIFNFKSKSFIILEKLDRGLLKLFPFLVYFCWSAVIECKEPKK
jgi:2-polyprenyl-3-methyl-5-hydroxy-6-metoxy-1,4-benzoquinol methylase